MWEQKCVVQNDSVSKGKGCEVEMVQAWDSSGCGRQHGEMAALRHSCKPQHLPTPRHITVTLDLLDTGQCSLCARCCCAPVKHLMAEEHSYPQFREASKHREVEL